ncbi:MAG: arginase [Deltaproteobacteria bacterium]|nr:MAG: arginase [Deltaproteobacteria bacterium]
MRTIRILGVPIDMGAGRRGVDMGVSAVRLAGLTKVLTELGHTVEDCGNIEVPVVETLDAERGLHYLNSIAQTCRNVYNWNRGVSKEDFAITLGGDHSIAMGSVAGIAEHGRTGVIWIDAHTDINTPKSSPSGNLHGTPLAHLLGHGDPVLREYWGGEAVIRPEDVVYIGLRSVDGGERSLVRQLGIDAYTMKEIDIQGIATVTQKTIEKLKHLDRVHVSFDVDALDPTIAPGVGTPVKGGLNYREAHLVMELLHDANIVTSLDVVEVNPILDVQNQTAQVAVEMVASLLGQSII